MKVTLPSHAPIKWVLSFVLILAVVQVLQGATLLLACTAGAFIVLASLAFNAAGGLQYPSGAYIFFNALLSATLGIVMKAVLGEPLSTNLTDAQYTLTVYTAGMASVLVASLLNRRLRRHPPLLKNTIKNIRADQVGLGCLIISALATYAAPESIRGTVNQFNRFSVLAVLLTVAARTKETDGRRSFTWVAFLAWSLTSIIGVFSFSKEAIFTPSVAWAIGAVASGYRISWTKIFVLAAITIPSVVLLTPFSQLGRAYQTEGNSVGAAIDLLSHPLETRDLYEREQAEYYLVGADYHWFDKPQGILDRLTLVPIDDALIYATDHGHPGELAAVWSYFVNVVPRYLYPDKPRLHWGNVYSHEIGLLGEGDETTGISFTPYSEAYHTGRWLGVTLVSCGMFLILFFVCDSVTGSINDSPWALLYIASFSHQAAEGALGALVYQSTTFTLAVIAAQLIATYVAPILGAFAIPPRRSQAGEPITLPGIARGGAFGTS